VQPETAWQGQNWSAFAVTFTGYIGVYPNKVKL
jgi:hypothetical protein